MFEDIIGRINYTKLNEIHKNVAPIRGHNVWPLGFRKYSARHFAPRKDGSYELWYWNLSSKNITDAEKLSPLAIVHSDNTIEIATTRTMYQSDYWMLNVGMGDRALWQSPRNHNPLIGTSVKYGGEYLQYISQRRLPLFKGMRWNLDTGKFHDDHGFTVRKWVVDRKLSDGIRKRYADQIKACKVMVRQFDEKSFIRFVNDLTEDAEAFVKPYFDKDEIQIHYAHGMMWALPSPL